VHVRPAKVERLNTLLLHVYCRSLIFDFFLSSVYFFGRSQIHFSLAAPSWISLRGRPDPHVCLLTLSTPPLPGFPRFSQVLPYLCTFILFLPDSPRYFHTCAHSYSSSQVLPGTSRYFHTCAHSYSCSQVLLVHSHPFCILQPLLPVHIPYRHSIPVPI